MSTAANRVRSKEKLMSAGNVDDVFQRLMDLADVPQDARSAILVTLNELKARYPDDTPARLVARARRDGAAIPTGRCAHRVRRGECVSCDSKIGPRLYFTAGGNHLHTSPTCAEIGRPSDGATPARRTREPIEVTSADDVRARCPVCVKTPARLRQPRKAATPTGARTTAREQPPVVASASADPAVTMP